MAIRPSYGDPSELRPVCAGPVRVQMPIDPNPSIRVSPPAQMRDGWGGGGGARREREWEGGRGRGREGEGEGEGEGEAAGGSEKEKERD